MAIQKFYSVKQLDAHTWQIGDPFDTYFYLVEGKDLAVLFDAGNGLPGVKELVKKLTDRPVIVLLSHGHYDHTGAAFEFGETLIHKEDELLLRSGFSMMSRVNTLRTYQGRFRLEVGQEAFRYYCGAREPKHVRNIRENERIELGGRSLRIIETPAHTRGSICALDEERGFLFSGDTVCDDEILVYFDDSTCVKDVWEAGKKLMEIKDGFRTICPGHHRFPLPVTIIEDYMQAAAEILANPRIGQKIELEEGSKILYRYKTIGISYRTDNVYKSMSVLNICKKDGYEV